MEQDNRPPRTLLLLVAEPDAQERGRIERFLQQHGHRVRTAATGAETLESVSEEWPDLLLLDLALPDAHWFDIAQQLRRDPKHLVNILLMHPGPLGEDDLRRAYRLGVYWGRPKPIDLSELEPLLRRWREAL